MPLMFIIRGILWCCWVTNFQRQTHCNSIWQYYVGMITEWKGFWTSTNVGQGLVLLLEYWLDGCDLLLVDLMWMTACPALRIWGYIIINYNVNVYYIILLGIIINKNNNYY